MNHSNSANKKQKPLSEITITDLPFIRQMPVLPDGIIIYDMKTGDKRSGRLEFTPEMKSNLVRFAKENAKEYLEKQNENLDEPPKSVESKPKRTA